MVLGLRTRTRKGASVQVEYVVHIQEIKPWPPSQSLKSLRSIVLQWENGEKNFGSLGPVVPSLGSVIGEGKIEFNEAIKLSVTLSREVSGRSPDASAFQKNCLELNFYEPRRDKTSKGQHLGNVTIDLAEYGIIKDPVNLSVPMNCKRSFRNTVQPLLFAKIQPFDKSRNSSSSTENLSKESSFDKDAKESISALMNEEYAEEQAEIASFTDDDISSHSSFTVSSSVFEPTGTSPSRSDSTDVKRVPEQRSTEAKENSGRENGRGDLWSEKEYTKSVPNSITISADQNGMSSVSYSDLPFNPGKQESHGTSVPKCPDMSLVTKTESSIDMIDVLGENVDGNLEAKKNNESSETKENETLSLKGRVEAFGKGTHVRNEERLAGTTHDDGLSKGILQAVITSKHQVAMEESSDEPSDDSKHVDGQSSCADSTKQISLATVASNENTPVNQLSRQVAPGGNPFTASRRNLSIKTNNTSSDQFKNLSFTEVEESDVAKDTYSYPKNHFTNKPNDEGTSKRFGGDKIGWVPRETLNNFSASKVRKLEHKIELLEAELREVAALELGLYSVIAEHGSSTQKVHAPARRLSRLYIHASKYWSRERSASTAKSVASGLVLVAKGCGNDVPRLTFWLSNSILLRAIITQAFRSSSLPVSVGSDVKTNGDSQSKVRSSSLLARKKCTPSKKQETLLSSQEPDNWEDPQTFINALEKVEAWIFTRIIESIWWQILTPHMQPSQEDISGQKIGVFSKKGLNRKSSSVDQEQGLFSINLWKRAFRDAFERICPIRAAGHECGCLPLLAKLVMEQCVARLDVAMFNAILREFDDDIPTDPVSDPIGNSKVLPIPLGKTSFGAGAQLKNAIGNWSRWLTDLFGMDTDDSPDDENGIDDWEDPAATVKSFHLLNALSDLLMLPKDMLLDSSIRKEVCPTFGAPLIKQILYTFVPDEFCPDPIPESLLEALDSEDYTGSEEESNRNFPCCASLIVYSPPSATLIAKVIDVGHASQLKSGSSVLRKGQTSDDELDELDMPLNSIITDSRQSPSPTAKSWKAKGKDSASAVRFHLLQEVWRDGE